MPELTITSPFVHSRVDSNTFTMGNPMPGSTLTLCQSQLYPPDRDFGFGFGFVPGMAIFSGFLRRKTVRKNFNLLRLGTTIFFLKLVTFTVCSQSHQSGVSSRGSSHFYFEKTWIDWLLCTRRQPFLFQQTLIDWLLCTRRQPFYFSNMQVDWLIAMHETAGGIFISLICDLTDLSTRYGSSYLF